MWIAMIQTSVVIPLERSGRNRISPRVMTIIDWASRIHGRRRPSACWAKSNRSITGPQMNLNVHGNCAMKVTPATSEIEYPSEARYVARVPATNPNGMP